MNISISETVLKKLTHKHRVTRDEIRQCFENRCGGFLEDDREQHKTDPATQWFISEANQRRKLKVVFIVREIKSGQRIDIRTTYEPNAEEIRIYEKHSK